jgi:hypothetical protein
MRNILRLSAIALSSHLYSSSTTTTELPTEPSTTTGESTTTTEGSTTTPSSESTTTTETPAPDNEIAGLGAGNAMIEDGGCISICNNEVEACANDPHSHGSYCKFWQNPPVCFGLYVLANQTTDNNGTTVSPGNSSSYCFQPNDPGCDDMVLQPLICPDQANTTCANICSQTASCISGPDYRGSFCQADNTCYGLFWTDSYMTQTCYGPNDAQCPSTFPISCNATLMSETTTIVPTTTIANTTGTGSTTETPTTTAAETTTTEAGTTEPASTETTTLIPETTAT